jgi:hypothetical protein
MRPISSALAATRVASWRERRENEVNTRAINMNAHRPLGFRIAHNNSRDIVQNRK